MLPLIPSYLTFVTGVGFDELGTARRAALIHALLFVLGFTLIFVALGASATVLGRVLIHYRVWITRIGGALIVLFGLYLLGVVRVAAFDRERRVHLANKPVGYLGSVLVGVAFGAGWTPCLGPILGAILTYTAATADLSRGLPLLLAYSLGLALPFLLAAVAVERFLETVSRLRPHLARVSQGDDLAAVKKATDDLQRAAHAVSESLYKGSSGSSGSTGSSGAGVKDAEVVDAEYAESV